MTTAILDAESGPRGNAVVRYWEILTPLAAGDTVGITVEADTYLHTVPAGGQNLSQALTDLSTLMAAGGYFGAPSNSEFDQCLHVRSATIGTAVTVSLPVYVVA